MKDGPRHAFFIGPSAPGGSLVRAISAALERCEPPVSVGAWDEVSAGPALGQLGRELRAAAILLADVRDLNPNVFYEIGAFHTLGRTAVLFKSKEQKLPFDVSTEWAIDVPDAGNVDDEVWRERVRKAVETAFERTASSPLGLHSQVSDANLPRLERTLERMAWSGVLPVLQREAVRLDARVFHLDHGLGRVTGFVEDNDGLRISVEFESGATLGVSVPHDRILVADAVPPATASG